MAEPVLDTEENLGDADAHENPDEAEGEAEKDWWDDPSMPWRNKPGRSDIACMVWIGVAGIIALCMLPLRAWLLGAPERLPWMVAIIGSRTGTTGLGSLIAVGHDLPYIWPLAIGTLMSVKLDWVYWWAGKLWGRGMIEVWAGQSERAARRYARVERWAHKLGWIGIFIAYVPIPLPIMPVVFVLCGAQGMSWKKFMILDYLASLIWLIGFFAFGYHVGEPAVEVLKYYSKIANWVAIALVVFVVAVSFRNASKKNATEKKV